MCLALVVHVSACVCCAAALEARRFLTRASAEYDFFARKQIGTRTSYLLLRYHHLLLHFSCFDGALLRPLGSAPVLPVSFPASIRVTYFCSFAAFPQMMLVGERINMSQLTPVQPLTNIYLAQLEPLTEIKLRLGRTLARKPHPGTPRWPEALRALEQGLELAKVASVSRKPLEAHLLFSLGRNSALLCPLPPLPSPPLPSPPLPSPPLSLSRPCIFR